VYSYLVFKVQTSIREIALSKLNQTTEYVDQLTTESGSLTIPLSLNVDVQTFSLLYILRKEVIQPHLPIRLPCYDFTRSEEHTSELQSRFDLVCRLLLEKKKESRKSRRPSQISSR